MGVQHIVPIPQNLMKSFIVDVVLHRQVMHAVGCSTAKHLGVVGLFVSTVIAIRYLRGAEIYWSYDLLGGIAGISALWVLSVAKTFAAAYRKSSEWIKKSQHDT